MSVALSMWMVYDHPKDFPNNYVARRFEVTPGGSTVMTDELLITADIDRLRRELERRGLVKLMRMPEDDSAIMETWL